MNSVDRKQRRYLILETGGPVLARCRPACCIRLCGHINRGKIDFDEATSDFHGGTSPV